MSSSTTNELTPRDRRRSAPANIRQSPQSPQNNMVDTAAASQSDIAYRPALVKIASCFDKEEHLSVEVPAGCAADNRGLPPLIAPAKESILPPYQQRRTSPAALHDHQQQQNIHLASSVSNISHGSPYHPLSPGSLPFTAAAGITAHMSQGQSTLNVQQGQLPPTARPSPRSSPTPPRLRASTSSSPPQTATHVAQFSCGPSSLGVRSGNHKASHTIGSGSLTQRQPPKSKER